MFVSVSIPQPTSTARSEATPWGVLLFSGARRIIFIEGAYLFWVIHSVHHHLHLDALVAGTRPHLFHGPMVVIEAILALTQRVPVQVGVGQPIL